MAYAANLGRGDIVYPGLIAAWSAKGKSNNDEDRAILKDLTGNGHDITLNGFAFSEMSGYGGYNWNFNNFTRNNWEHTGSKIILDYNNRPSEYPNVFEYTGIKFVKLVNPPLKIRVTGITSSWFVMYYTYNFKNSDPISKSIRITKDGEYELPSLTLTEEQLKNIAISYFGFNISIKEGERVVIDQIPNYEDALVFDGVDDYGSAVDFGGKEIKTVISKYSTLSVSINRFSLYFRDPSNGNIFQRIRTLKIQSNPSIRAYSDNVTLLDDYCKLERNTKALTKPFQITGYHGNIEVENIAFYSAYLFDRSLDEQEIKSFIRKYIDPEYLLPSGIPTPDCYYDFSQGSNDDETRETITDLSGNGNNAVAHNFAWNEEGSGYKDGALVFDGVDDYVSLDAFDSGFKTVFIVCNFHQSYKFIYDQRSSCNALMQYALYTEPNSPAYYVRNSEGKTYINNKYNVDILSSELVNKKHCIVNVNSNLVQNTIPRIGGNAEGTSQMDMALYKFLGFKEALTEEQINAIIKKYNLLDGVDEIEVS